MSEWQLQKALRGRWLSEGAQIDGEVLFLAGWEVMTNWEVNDAHKRWDLPSADFVLLDKQGRLVVMELKTAIRGPGDCLRALCQVTHSAVLSMASRNCPMADMKTAHWWPWDLPSGGHQRRWFRCGALRSPWLGGGQIRSA